MELYIRIISIFLLLICSDRILAQNADSLKTTAINYSAYIDVYYQYDFNRPLKNERPVFLYNYKRNNEIAVNLGLLKASYTNRKVALNIGLMFGDYANYNLAAEPFLYRHIYEANITYNLDSETNVQVGIMPSHIGFETAISKDNWNVSRSLLAENSPYFETGIKFTRKFSPKLSAAVLVLNGWQNIRENNSNKALGSQIEYIFTDKLSVNSSSFLGNEKPDSAKQYRFFHDLYILYKITGKLKTALIFDFGIEQKLKQRQYNNWLGTCFLAQYAINSKINAALRAEYYLDKNNIIIPSINNHGFNATGYAFNFDYILSDNLIWRIENRYLHSKNAVFEKRSVIFSKNNYSILTAFTASF
jgi:hypothetical protein